MRRPKACCDAALNITPGREAEGATMNKIALIIDGEASTATGGATFERKDPMTGKVATTTAAATVDDVDRTVNAAAKAFETWSETGPGTRRALLLKGADIMGRS